MEHENFPPKENSSLSNSNNNNTYNGDGKTVENGDVSADYNEPQLFSDNTILVVAHSLGIDSITTEACYYLANSVSYKIMEIIYTANIILHKTKRKKLGVYEVNKALEMLKQPPIYGYSDPDGSHFRTQRNSASLERLLSTHNVEPKIATGDPKHPYVELHFQEDEEHDLYSSLSDFNFNTDRELNLEQESEAAVQGHWFVTDCVYKFIKERKDRPFDIPPYFRQIANAIMSGKAPLIKVAINDLRTNPKIGLVCQYLLNMVIRIVKEIARDVTLTSAAIDVVRAVHLNKFVDPSGFHAVNRAVNCLLKVAIDEKTMPGGDDFLVRIQAGYLMSRVIHTWKIETHQQGLMVHHSMKYLQNKELPPQSHYGAIIALTSLGQKALIESMWPALLSYLLQHRHKQNNVAILNIFAAFKMAATVTYKRAVRLKQSPFFHIDKRILSNIFGDSLTPFRCVLLPLLEGLPVFPFKIREHNYYPYFKPILKLRQRPKTHSVLNQPKSKTIDIRDIFETHGQIKRRKLPQAIYYSPKKKPNKNVYPTFTRNTKFYTQLHKTSPSGDLLLKL